MDFIAAWAISWDSSVPVVSPAHLCHYRALPVQPHLWTLLVIHLLMVADFNQTQNNTFHIGALSEQTLAYLKKIKIIKTLFQNLALCCTKL